MKYGLSLLWVFFSLQGALAEPGNGTTVCTPPAGTCYLGSGLVSNNGTKYYSFQGIRSGPQV